MQQITGEEPPDIQMSDNGFLGMTFHGMPGKILRMDLRLHVQRKGRWFYIVFAIVVIHSSFIICYFSLLRQRRPTHRRDVLVVLMAALSNQKRKKKKHV
jgi:hypothetical protein